MRRGCSNVTAIAANGIFYGISLGYDFCAEHEWGIAGIKRKLGINEESPKLGIDGRIITNHDRVKLLDDGNYMLLTSRAKSDDIAKEIPYDIKYLAQDKTDVYLETAWSGDDFAIITNDKDIREYLTELYAAFQTNDIAIATLSGGIFESTSLSVLIASRIPKEQRDEMYYVDKKRVDLMKYEAKIGVTALKEAARGGGYQSIHYFMACSPKWIDYDDEQNRKRLKKEKKTKFDIQFWINYSDDDNNYGWYTAEEIIKWLGTPGLKLTQIRKANK